MPVQSLIWTALPNGVSADGRALRISLLLSPRLEPESAPPSLSSFADFEDWPDTLRRSQITVTIGDTAIALTADHVDASIGVADSAVWRALLPTTTRVQSYKMTDHTDTRVLSFDAVALHDAIRKVYGSLTVTPAKICLPLVSCARAMPSSH